MEVTQNDIINLLRSIHHLERPFKFLRSVSLPSASQLVLVSRFEKMGEWVALFANRALRPVPIVFGLTNHNYVAGAPAPIQGSLGSTGGMSTLQRPRPRQFRALSSIPPKFIDIFIYIGCKTVILLHSTHIQTQEVTSTSRERSETNGLTLSDYLNCYHQV